jgi:enterochelin esterase-like enzyme
MTYNIQKKLIGILVVLTTYCQSKTSKEVAKSEFLTDSIFSQSLSEYRKHNVYLPKGFSREKNYPIIYATDGNSALTDKKETLDSLIELNFIKPVIFVASFANNRIADSTSVTTGDGKKVKLGYRNFEYINDFASTTEDAALARRFDNHKFYFTNELINYIEKEYNQNIEKEQRYFYGVSNGAGFGLSLLNNEPELIGTYLCFSTFGGDIQTNQWKAEVTYPKLYLKYGSEEPISLKYDAEFLKKKYKESNSFIDIEEYKGHHHNDFWRQEFIETVIKILN